jgi:5-methylcytosine-specific restriction endonuclease McrA
VAKRVITQGSLILEYFVANPNRDIPHQEVVDWATAEYERRCGQKFRDPDRFIRKLGQEGRLTKVSKGVYRYEPAHVRVRVLQDFDGATKAMILQRDGHRCVVCGRGRKEGVDLQVDHVMPKDRGGPATLENGQTLCAQHNFQKKNYEATEFGERLFVRLRDTAVKVEDLDMISFCDDILAVFRRHGQR